MATLFVSDVHLSGARPDLVALFLGFLAREARVADALYILGDLFDLWVGDDDPDPLNRQVIAGLSALTGAGVPVFVMHGNRDFTLGARFARESGARLLPDPSVIDLYGTPTLLMHGDTLCTDDLQYQRARARYRQPWVLALSLALPRAVRVAIGRRLRAKSERAKQTLAPEIMDVNAGAVEAAFRARSCTRLIHGHTHRPARHEHQLAGQSCERWVLADWYRSGSYLRCDAAGCKAVALP
ncbi:MAG: UDP-2,3-diacylglucosamine diphosphatase [Burkholderiales bacterium]